ncbi:hypothetical protein D3C71_1812560 [compost metagenome]
MFCRISKAPVAGSDLMLASPSVMPAITVPEPGSRRLVSTSPTMMAKVVIAKK